MVSHIPIEFSHPLRSFTHYKLRDHNLMKLIIKEAP